MSIKTSLDLFSELIEKRDEARFGFIKQILLMASGEMVFLFARNKTEDNILNHG